MMNTKDLKEMAQSLRSLGSEAEREAFWAEQRARINALTPGQRKADVAAIRQRVAEIAQSLQKEKKDQAA
jgi:lipid A disaccharide synthetase